MANYLSPLVGDDATLAEIGRLCAYWSFAESMVENMVWDALELSPEAGEIVTTKADMRGRFDLLSRSTKAVGASEEYRQAVSELRAIFKGLQERRNLHVHGLWIWSDDWRTPSLFTMRYPFNGDPQDVSSESVRALNEEISASVQKLDDLRRNLKL